MPSTRSGPTHGSLGGKPRVADPSARGFSLRLYPTLPKRNEVRVRSLFEATFGFSEAFGHV
jgi:hypothetical protein